MPESMVAWRRKRRLFVDFENVQKMNLAALSDDFEVSVFVGCSQKSIPFALVQDAQALGTRLEWIKVEGGGSNALDFHIAYYLGSLLAQCPRTQCFILSRDTGFDPLLRQLEKKGLSCRRISSLTELEAKPKVKSVAPDASNYERVVASLKKIANKPKPKKKAGLANHISTLFAKQLSKAEVEGLIAQLIEDGLVAETGKTLAYIV